MKDGNIHVTDFYTSIITDALCITVSGPIRDKNDEILQPLFHFLVDSAHQSVDRGINHRGKESDHYWFRSHVVSSFRTILYFTFVDLP